MKTPDYTVLLDDEIRAYVAQCAAMASENQTAGQMRDSYRATCARFDTPIPQGIAVADQQVAGVPTRVYTPERAGETQIIYYHGGGFVLGDLETHHSICGDLAAATGQVVRAVAYRLAPEHPHPAALDDSLAVLDAQPAPALLVGDSAGATLAAALAHLRPDKVSGMALIYPWLAAPGAYPSFAEHADAPLLPAAALHVFERLRLDGQARPSDPGYFPLMATDFSRLPPCHISTAQCDPLADEGAAYHHAILGAGGMSTLTIENGLMHGHLRARHVSRKAGAAFNRFCTAICNL